MKVSHNRVHVKYAGNLKYKMPVVQAFLNRRPLDGGKKKANNKIQTPSSVF